MPTLEELVSQHGQHWLSPSLAKSLHRRFQANSDLYTQITEYMGNEDVQEFRGGDFGFVVFANNDLAYKFVPSSHLNIIAIPQVIQPHRLSVFPRDAQAEGFAERVMKQQSFIVAETPRAFVLAKGVAARKPDEIAISSSRLDKYIRKELMQHGLGYHADNVANNIGLLGPHPDYPEEFKHYLPVLLDYGLVGRLEGETKTFEECIASARQSSAYTYEASDGKILPMQRKVAGEFLPFQEQDKVLEPLTFRFKTAFESLSGSEPFFGA